MLRPSSKHLFHSEIGRRTFSQSAARQNYEATIQNLLIHKDTKVLCQGLTGKTVSADRHVVPTYAHTLLAGYFPRKGSSGLWHQHGRRRVAEEGWPDTPRTPHLRHSQGGTSSRVPSGSL